eukprot:1907559-Rhodomonas_salina.4
MVATTTPMTPPSTASAARAACFFDITLSPTPVLPRRPRDSAVPLPPSLPLVDTDSGVRRGSVATA